MEYRKKLQKVLSKNSEYHVNEVSKVLRRPWLRENFKVEQTLKCSCDRNPSSLLDTECIQTSEFEGPTFSVCKANHDRLSNHLKSPSIILENHNSTYKNVWKLYDQLKMKLTSDTISSEEQFNLVMKFLRDWISIAPDLKDLLENVSNMLQDIYRQNKSFDKYGDKNKYESVCSNLKSPTYCSSLHESKKDVNGLEIEFSGNLLRNQILKEKVEHAKEIYEELCHQKDVEQKENSLALELEQLHIECVQYKNQIEEIKKDILKYYSKKCVFHELEKEYLLSNNQIQMLKTEYDQNIKSIELYESKLIQYMNSSGIDESMKIKIWDVIKNGKLEEMDELGEERWNWYIS